MKHLIMQTVLQPRCDRLCGGCKPSGHPRVHECPVCMRYAGLPCSESCIELRSLGVTPAVQESGVANAPGQATAAAPATTTAPAPAPQGGHRVAALATGAAAVAATTALALMV